MYKLELNKEEFTLHVNGLDAQIRLVCGQITNAQSSGAALKTALPQLIKIDQQFDKLSQIMQLQEVDNNLPRGVTATVEKGVARQ